MQQMQPPITGRLRSYLSTCFSQHYAVKSLICSTLFSSTHVADMMAHPFSRREDLNLLRLSGTTPAPFLCEPSLAEKCPVEYQCGPVARTRIKQWRRVKSAIGISPTQAGPYWNMYLERRRRSKRARRYI